MRIAHVTDLHLRRAIPGAPVQPARRGRETTDLLLRALADLRDRDIDVLVLTGDLIDVPHYLFDIERDPAADAEAWRLVREDYRWLRRTLDASGLRWIALPGNHDSYRLTREELGGAPMVEDIAGVRFVSFWDREHEEHVPQRILAERHRFEALVRAADRTPQVHLQHFVIAPERNEGYPTTYLEADEMVRSLSTADHLTVALSGHHHPGALPEEHGNALFSITPAFTEAPHPYRIFEVEPSDSPSGATVTWEEVALGAREAGPAVFLDRDGCINTLAAYHSGPEAMELIPGAALAIRRFCDAGFRVVVITNQTGVGLGYVTPAVVAEVNDRMHALLAAEGAVVDAVYMSFDAGDHAVADRYRSRGPARKPNPEMLEAAAVTLGIDLARSVIVGDRESDVAAGQAAGVAPILVRTGLGRLTEREHSELGCPIVDDLLGAADAVLSPHPDMTTAPLTLVR